MFYIKFRSFRGGRHLKLSTIAEIMAVTLLIVFVGWSIFRINAAHEWNSEIKNHLEIAATTSSLEEARTEIGIALERIEARGITEGRPFLAMPDPGNDIGLWYKSLKDLHANLLDLGENPSQHEANTALLLVKKTIMAEGLSEKVKQPQDISAAHLPWFASGPAGFLYLIAALALGFCTPYLEELEERWKARRTRRSAAS